MVTPYSGLRPVLCTQEAFTNFAITYFLTVVPSQRGEGTLLTGLALGGTEAEEGWRKEVSRTCQARNTCLLQWLW